MNAGHGQIDGKDDRGIPRGGMKGVWGGAVVRVVRVGKVGGFTVWGAP